LIYLQSKTQKKRKTGAGHLATLMGLAGAVLLDDSEEEVEEEEEEDEESDDDDDDDEHPKGVRNCRIQNRAGGRVRVNPG